MTDHDNSLNTRIGHDRQMFVHTTEPTPDAFDPPQNTEGMPNKPDGGLWTSTLRDDGSSAWLDWCRAEQWGTSADHSTYALDPEPDVGVLVIDSEPDLRNVLAEYRHERRHLPETFAALDFEAIAEDFDAIHLTENGQRETRFSRPGLYGWDAESTLWLRWAFTAVNHLPTTPPWRDEDIIHEMYEEQGLTIAEIADHFGISTETVRQWLDKYNIGIDTPGETQ